MSDDRGVLVGRQPLGDRGVVRGATLLDGDPVLREQQLEVVPRITLQRAQHLVDLHRLGPLRDRERVAVTHRRRGGGPRLDVDEEVALQEDPRANRERGVRVQRQADVIDLHRDVGHLALLLGPGGQLAALHRGDVGDHADVDAGDPDERLRPETVRVREQRVNGELARERVRELRVREVGDEHDGDRAERARRHRAHPVSLSTLASQLFPGTGASCGPNCGLRLNVSPAGTWARPLNVVP